VSEGILYAPWRSEFVQSPSSNGCVLCRARDAADRDGLVVHRGELGFVMLNLYPYNSGHLMVVPNRHVGDLPGLSSEERLELFDLCSRSVERLGRAFGPEGFNVGMNIGRVAGAGIEDHVHLHVVPRWAGDTNFMPVLGETKVLSVGMDEVFEKLTRAFAETES
jgi:ATP adenylyltransferase